MIVFPHQFPRLDQDIHDKTESVTTIDATIAELEAQRDAESGGKLQELEAKVREAIKLDAVAQSTLKSESYARSGFSFFLRARVSICLCPCLSVIL